MKKILLAIISVLLLSCQRDLVFTQFSTLPSTGWEADSVLTFSPIKVDSLSAYDLHVVLRHTDRYAYQNLWLFVEIRQDTTLLRRDTINGMLADNEGMWYGGGIYVLELPLLYLEALPLEADAEYKVLIQQAMRESNLQGILDVGLKVTRHGKE